MESEPVLECQDCGKVLCTLTPAQAQKVAANPYNYIVFCGPCQRENDHIGSRHG